MTLKYDVIGLQNCMHTIQIAPEIEYGGCKHKIVVNLPFTAINFVRVFGVILITHSYSIALVVQIL